MGARERGLEVLPRSSRAALRDLLVATVAAADAADDRAPALDELARDAPVHLLPDAAMLHRLPGTVLRGIGGCTEIPHDVIDRLGKDAQRATVRHRLLTGVLDRLGRVLDEAEIPWVTMRGPVASGRLYRTPGDRWYSDLDVLVDRRSFPDVVSILESLGYRNVIRNWPLAEEMSAGEIELATSSLHVDLHWHLHYSAMDRAPFALDPTAMIARSRRVSISGTDLPTFDPVDTLLTSAFYAARSGGHRLVWLKDLERILVVDRPDLDELVRRCRLSRCAPPVGLALDRARRLLGARFPAEVVNALVPATLRAVESVGRAGGGPVRLHERATYDRFVARSARATTAATLAWLPARTIRWFERRYRPPAEHETDDPDEKASYLASVASST